MSTASATRSRLRLLHIVTGIAIGTYVYSPWSDLIWFDLAIKAGVLPALAVTGVWMWQQGRIRRWLKG